MSTFGAVLVHGPVSPAFYARAADLGLTARKAPLPTADLWVKALGSTSEDTLTAATRMSRTIDGRILALYGREDLDIYVLAEARAGEVVRRMLYVRDDGGWKLTGQPQPWESDFHFVHPLPELAAWLEASEWLPTDVEAARHAHRMHDVGLLKIPPPPRMIQLVQYVQRLGFDWDEGPHAEWHPQGFLGRLLGM